MRFTWTSLLAAPILASSFGCASTTGVRYVYQDGDYGVVGMPENSDRWPTHYRTKAEKLMADHFPEGHEIVRAEEVVEGSRTLKLEGSRTAEVAPALPAALVNVAKLGGSASRSQADTLKITECRIIYRRAGGPVVPGAYADVPTLTPTLYLDPNASERRKAEEKPHRPEEKNGEGSKMGGEPAEPPLRMIPPRGDG